MAQIIHAFVLLYCFTWYGMKLSNPCVVAIDVMASFGDKKHFYFVLKVGNFNKHLNGDGLTFGASILWSLPFFLHFKLGIHFSKLELVPWLQWQYITLKG